MPSASPTPRPDLLGPLRTKGWLTEAQRKAFHVSCIVLPLALLYEPLPWPRGRGEWRLFLLGILLAAVALDVLRINHHRVRSFFRRFFGELIREHEGFNLLGSTYIVLAALLAVEILPQPLAGAALGFTILGDGFAAIVGKAYGRRRIFNKTVEGCLGGLAACLVWAGFLAAGGFVPITAGILAALVASLVELLPIPLDDNLGITLAAGYALKLLVST